MLQVYILTIFPLWTSKITLPFKTHLSSKDYSALPDSASIFKRMPGKNCHASTEEEDHTLKAGYDKYGTVWATILKDPIFQEQNCCSTDLCGHFCNAFPNLYQASGYRPHNSTKKLSTAACTMTNDVTIWTATPSSKSSFLTFLLTWCPYLWTIIGTVLILTIATHPI
ncbi:hypothetical protein V8E53_013478 [Lactarius tabidus]